MALEGFAELAAAMRHAVTGGPAGRPAVAALAAAYVEFAECNPALYDAMFLLDTGLPFADAATPAPLREGFETLLDTLGDLAGDAEPGLFVEVFCSALHGLAHLRVRHKVSITAHHSNDGTTVTGNFRATEPFPFELDLFRLTDRRA